VNDMSEFDLYPRVLIVNGEPLSEQSAMGINLVSLFGAWPAGKLAQLFTARIDPLPASCAHSWRLDTLSRSPRPVACEPATPRTAQTPWNLRARATGRLRNVARVALDLAPYRTSAELHKALRRFRPQVIYSCLGSIQLCRLASRLAKAYAIPVVPHFTDDWISTEYRNNPLLACHRLALLHSLRSTMRHAHVGITVTDRMAEEYQAKFGIPFHAFMNPVAAPSEWPGLQETAGHLRFVYVGGLHLRRWQSLREIGEGLLELRQKGVQTTLDIYAPAADLEKYGGRLAIPFVRLAGTLGQEQVFDAMLGGDVLVHVESFDEDMRAMTRLSMSTKISQYMAAGRPLFCYGPGEVTSCRYVASMQAGIVVGSRDPAVLSDELNRLCHNRDLRIESGRQAWAAAKRRHDSTAVRNTFRAVLSEAARGAGRMAAAEIDPASEATPVRGCQS